MWSLMSGSPAGIAVQLLQVVEIHPHISSMPSARYQYVDIDQNTQKDKKKLKPGLDNFLLPDAAASGWSNDSCCRALSRGHSAAAPSSFTFHPPAQVANYDESWPSISCFVRHLVLEVKPCERLLHPSKDWNEFFCDPSRMVEGLLLQDGTRLFDLQHERRFLALPRVDWQAPVTKSMP